MSVAPPTAADRCRQCHGHLCAIGGEYRCCNCGLPVRDEVGEKAVTVAPADPAPALQEAATKAATAAGHRAGRRGRNFAE